MLGATLCYMDARARLDVRMIGRRVAERRAMLRIEQGELAESAGLSRAYISRLESGAVLNPKLLDLERVASALNTSIIDLTVATDDLGSTAALRREAQAVLGFGNAELVETIVKLVADKPARDREVVLRVAANLVRTFPPLQPDPTSPDPE